MVSFRERVHMPLWVAILFLAGFFGMIGGAIYTILAKQMFVGACLAGGGILFGLLYAAMRWFEVEIDGSGIRYRWTRFFGNEIPIEAIEAVRVEPYKWYMYGGWGLRVAGRSMAYSWPGIGTSLIVTRDKGLLRNFVFTLKDADRAKQVLDQKRNG